MNDALVPSAADDELLSPRQQAFVAAYVGEAHCNGTKAAILAGYSPASAYNEAYRLLKDAAVRGRIREILAAHLVSQEAILSELAAVAFAPTSHFQQVINEYTDKQGVVHQVIRLDYSAKVKALELLGKAEGMFSQVDVNVNIRETRTIVGISIEEVTGRNREGA